MFSKCKIILQNKSFLKDLIFNLILIQLKIKTPKSGSTQPAKTGFRLHVCFLFERTCRFSVTQNLDQHRQTAVMCCERGETGSLCCPAVSRMMSLFSPKQSIVPVFSVLWCLYFHCTVTQNQLCWVTLAQYNIDVKLRNNIWMSLIITK